MEYMDRYRGGHTALPDDTALPVETRCFASHPVSAGPIQYRMLKHTVNKVPALQALPSTVPQGRYSINRMLQRTVSPTGAYMASPDHTASPVETHGRASLRAMPSIRRVETRRFAQVTPLAYPRLGGDARPCVSTGMPYISCLNYDLCDLYDIHDFAYAAINHVFHINHSNHSSDRKTASPVETHGRASHPACAGPKGHILAKAELRFVTAGQRPAVTTTPHPRPGGPNRIVAVPPSGWRRGGLTIRRSLTCGYEDMALRAGAGGAETRSIASLRAMPDNGTSRTPSPTTVATCVGASGIHNGTSGTPSPTALKTIVRDPLVGGGVLDAPSFVLWERFCNPREEFCKGWEKFCNPWEKFCKGWEKFCKGREKFFPGLKCRSRWLICT
jgi:hypothetical protein